MYLHEANLLLLTKAEVNLLQMVSLMILKVSAHKSVLKQKRGTSYENDLSFQQELFLTLTAWYFYGIIKTVTES